MIGRRGSPRFVARIPAWPDIGETVSMVRTEVSATPEVVVSASHPAKRRFPKRFFISPLGALPPSEIRDADGGTRPQYLHPFPPERAPLLRSLDLALFLPSSREFIFYRIESTYRAPRGTFALCDRLAISLIVIVSSMPRLIVESRFAM